MPLEPRSIAFVTMVLAGTLFLLGALYWRSQRTFPGFGHWVLSLGLLAAVLALITWFGHLDSAWVGTGTNLGSVVLMTLIAIGAQRFLHDRDLDHLTLGLFAAAILAILGVATSATDSATRSAVGAIATGSLGLRASSLFLRDIRPGLRLGSGACAIVLAAFALVRFWRASFFLTADPSYHMLDAELASIVNYTVNAAFTILWPFAFLLLNSSRAERELLETQDELRRLAMTDPLTGLLNRRALFGMAEAEVQRCRRYGHALSVLMLDVDHFKDVNDRFGHPAGDAVLKEIAAFLRVESRDGDRIARVGGEEFALLLLETDGDEARKVATRIRDRARDLSVSAGDSDIRITVSIGLAELRTDDADFGGMLSRADRALYAVKAAGRDGVGPVGDPSEEPLPARTS